MRVLILDFAHWIKDKLSFLVPYETPLAAQAHEWAKWRRVTKEKHPIAFFLFEDLPISISSFWRTWFADPYYQCKCKYFLKHHHIKIDVERFFGVEYPDSKPRSFYHWYDSDTKILYGMFQILVDFMEKEDPGETIDWNADPEHKKVWVELQTLYKWWTKERPLKVKDCEYPSFTDYGKSREELGNRDSLAYKAWSKAIDECQMKEAELDNEDSEMLIRLITIRKWMWT